MVNLISNAIKFGRAKPIEIELGETPDQVTLTVIDHGIGIAPDRLPHIFERFERAVSTAHYGGLGLGLYIAREIVVALGGSIRAESELGVGSTFVVTLPRRSDRVRAQRVERRPRGRRLGLEAFARQPFTHSTCFSSGTISTRSCCCSITRSMFL